MADVQDDPSAVLLLVGQVHLSNGRQREAYESFRAAARNGGGAAMNMLGRCYQRGWGVARNRRLAASHFLCGARKGDAWAMFNLADLLNDGDEGERDAEAAYGWYSEAARKGVAKASNMLGLFHEDGEVVPRDPAAAIRLFVAAAQGGDCWGAFNVARCLIGEGRVEEARPWLELARAHGYPDFFRAIAPRLAGHPDPRVADYARSLSIEAVGGRSDEDEPHLSEVA